MTDTLRDFCDDLAINIRDDIVFPDFRKAGEYLMDVLMSEETWLDLAAAREAEIQLRKTQ